MTAAATPALKVVGADRPQPDGPPPLVAVPGYELYNEPTVRRPYLIDHLVPAGAKVALTGNRANWKSWSLTSLGCCVAAVEPYMGTFDVTPAERAVGGSVLFVQSEEGRDEAKRKYRWILSGMGLHRDPRRIQDLLVQYVVGQPFTLDQEGRLDQLKRIVDAQKPDLVMWDSLRRIMKGDSNSDEFAQRFVEYLDILQAVHPSAHVVVAHWRKKSGDKQLDEPGERVRGSSAIVDQMDVHIAVERNKADDYATMTQDKNRNGKEHPPFNFRMRIVDSEGLAYPQYIGTAPEEGPSSGGSVAVVDLLSSERGRAWPLPEVIRRLGGQWSSRQVRYAITQLERAKPQRVFVAQSSGRNPSTVRLIDPSGNPETEENLTNVTQPDKNGVTYGKPYADND